MPCAVIAANNIERVNYMKYCTKCGSEMEDNAVVCPQCGNVAKVAQATAIAKPVKSSGIGIAALGLSIIGFMTGFIGIGILFDVIAVILAIIALMKSKRIPTKTGLPIAGLIIAGISLILMTFTFGSGYINNIFEVKNVEKMIDNIGQVTIESKEAITAAEEGYENLSEEDKAKISNYETLVTAKETYIDIQKEGMLAEAQHIDIATIAKDAENNINIAKENYDNKIITTNVVVNDIEEDSVKCAGSWEYMLYALQGIATSDTTIYFADNDDLLKVNKGEQIKVVGQVEVFNNNSYYLHNAYLLSDEEYAQVDNKSN